MPELQIVRVRLLDPDEVPILDYQLIAEVVHKPDRTIRGITIPAEAVHLSIQQYSSGMSPRWAFTEIDGKRYTAQGRWLPRGACLLNQLIWADDRLPSNVVVVIAA